MKILDYFTSYVEQNILSNESYSINFEEFLIIGFRNEYPEILYDFLYYFARMQDKKRMTTDPKYYVFLHKQVNQQMLSKPIQNMYS